MGVEIQFEEKVDEAVKRLKGVAEERMAEVANMVRNNTLETLAGPRSGRVYRVPGTSRMYTASSPGEAPAVQLGDLRKSVKCGTERSGDEIIGFVGTDLPKGPMLEFGTSRMAARPWLRPSFEKSSDQIKMILMRIWL